MRRLIALSITAVLLLSIGMGAAPRWPWSVKGTLTVDPPSIKLGEKSVLTWDCSKAARSVDLDGEEVALSGSREVTPTETTNYTLTIRGKRLSMATMATVTVIDGVPDPVPPEPSPDPQPDPEPPAPTPTPDPVDGFSLSAVGFGSAFDVDSTLSAAARDKDIGELLRSQNGTWLVLTDEVMAVSHPKVFDDWVTLFNASGKKKPAVLFHDQGKVLSIEEVAGKTKLDILNLAKSVIPVSKDCVTIHGRIYRLGLKPEPLNAEKSALSVTKILNPIGEKECPFVDLSSQVRFIKDQVSGTCVLNSFAGACEAAVYTAYGAENCREFSPSFLANLTDGWNGTWGSEAAKMVQKYGNLFMDEMGPSQTRYPSNWKNIAEKNQVLALYGPPDSNPPGYIRAALNRGYIVCAGIAVGSGFDVDSSGFIGTWGMGRSINHEIRVVGYNPENGRYKIANSWGIDWGNKGFAWLDGKFFSEDTDLWVIVAIEANPGYKFYAPLNPSATQSKQVLQVPVEAVIKASKELNLSSNAPIVAPRKNNNMTRKTGTNCASGSCSIKSKPRKIR
jgi:hypothetical protein